MKSAAQRAAELIKGYAGTGIHIPLHTKEIVAPLLREDRQRRQMERAIVNYVGDPEVWMPGTKEAIVLWNIARQLRKNRG